MSSQSADYNFSEIEPSWQTYWGENKTFAASDETDKEKYFILDMFPYPSGAGLHVGHPEGYTGSDILARYHRAKGKNVLHPIGWDAFGLPTEQYAIKTGKRPQATSEENIANFRQQLQRIGFYYDYDREVNTTDPNYYRWTQWIFLQLFKKGLAYVDERPVWWCEELGTVLANEEVIDGKSERGSHPVVRKNLRQWVLKITAYAERLLNDLDGVDWPASTKKMQKEWIGKSTGSTARFAIDGMDGEFLEIYTTRPDTLMGATYMVVSPEHPLVDRLATAEHKEAVNAYKLAAANKSDLERTDLAKEKTGVFTGSYAVHPITGDKVPVWVADYVLISYGTGAIMAVPAHDTRDFEFAEQFNLPIVQVIKNSDDDVLPYIGDGVLVNSCQYDGMPWQEGKAKITADLTAKGQGEASTQYKLRDWLFSRQRYWGEPFPVAWVSKEDYDAAVASGVLTDWIPEEPVVFETESVTRFALPVPEKALPLELPHVESYEPSGTGESPLAKATDWLEIWYNYETGEYMPATEAKPEGERWVRATRETNTMPQWAGSCWYYLRYIDPRNPDAFADRAKQDYWQAPDLYIGGAEHAVLHLLYARFWHKVLYDEGLVPTKEPFTKLFHQGIILGEDNQKMSKSRGNVINPQIIIDEYGADTLRLYLMFLGPLEAMKPWSSKGIEGVHRFLKKAWRELVGQDGGVNPKIKDNADADSKETLKAINECVKKVTDDIENLRFNTAISAMMIFANHLQSSESVSLATARKFVQLLAPFAPHIGEELWNRLGGKPSVTTAAWPAVDESALVEDEIRVVFQVNGKLRGQGMVAKTANQDEVLAQAQADPKVAAHTEGKTVRKVIYVPGKILNIVAN